MRTLFALLAVTGRLFLSALNPRLGGARKPFAATYASVGRMLVEVFGALRLIERSHPWRRKGASVRVLDVLTLAWVRTNWRKPWEPVPIFVASTTLLLAIGFLALTATLVTGSVSATQAYAGGSLFSAPNAETDLALRYMRDTFGVDIPGTGPMIHNAVVEGFQQMMGLYSMAMLVVAGFILLYIILTSVAATAHEGRFGGNSFNQVWAPIRLVVAIGLLVPLPMGAYTGYNSGQYIVMVLARWGSALASNLWTPFAESIAKKGDVLAMPNIEPAASAVRGVLLAEFCRARYAAAKYRNYFDDGQAPPMEIKHSVNGATQMYSYAPVHSTTSRYCGVTMFEMPSENAVQPFVHNVLMKYENAYFDMRDSAAQLAAQLTTDNTIDFGAIPSTGNEERIWSVLQSGAGGAPGFLQIVTTYQNALREAALTAQVYHNASAADAMVAEVQEAGWAGAGMWFNTIARLNAEFMHAVRALPTTASPDVETAGKHADTAVARLLAQEVKSGVVILNRFMDGLPARLSFGSYAEAGYSTPISGPATSSVVAGFEPPENNKDPQDIGTGLDKVLGHGSAAVGEVLANVFNTFVGGPFGRMGTGTDTQLDDVYPLSDLAAIGDWMVNRSFVLFTISSVAFHDILVMLSVAGAGAGLTLLYVLPLLPFIRFLFGVMGWLLNILEAIIAIPLVAVAHLTTRGEGLSGDLARSAYFMIFSIFLRPALLIVGMIVALMMFSVAISVLNDMYKYAVLGFRGTAAGQANGGLSVIMYTVLYTVMAYMLCNLCFTMIETIPNKALTWINQASAREITQDEKVAGAIAAAGDHIVFTPMRSIKALR